MLRLCLRSRVRHFLHELPDSLDETYERILKGIHKTNRGYVQQLLQCLAVAIRPLRVEELSEILKFDVETIEGEVPTADADLRREEQEHELLSACPSLIIIVGSDDSRVVKFWHFSVKEFLTSGRLSTSRQDIVRYHIIPEAAHTTIARASLGALLRLDDSIPLVLYAAEHWVSHAQFGSVSSRVMGQMEALFDSERPYFSAWLRICDIDGTVPEGTTRSTPKPLYYSALCGFYDLIEHLLKKHSEDINAIGGKHDYPLIAALHGGYIEVAELLFQHGANVEVQGKDEQTPLHRAIGWPNTSAVTALHFLLKHGANVTALRKDLWTPLHLVAARGDFGVAQFLDYAAEGSPRDQKGATPMRGLLSGGFDIARALLDLGANVNAEDNRGWTPLHRVLRAEGYSDEQRFGIAQLLIERGADVNAQDQCYGTPLHLVPYFLQLKLVQMLIDHGANVNAKNNRGQTPLHRVLGTDDYSGEDRFRVAQLLLEHGADVNSRNACGETPLHLAPYFLELKLVPMLVDLSVDVNAEDNQSRTPLHRVLETHGHPDKDRFSIVQLLVERGADVNVNSRNENLETLSGQLQLSQMLVDLSADVNAEDDQSRTPLHRVLETHGHPDKDRSSLVQLLVERGAGVNVNARNENGETLLHWASYHGQLQFVRMLIDHGANVNAEDNQGRTPLHRASEAKGSSGGDHFSIAQLLMEHGADVNTRHENRETPLHSASYQGQLQLVQMLVDHGANVNAENSQARTPLHRVLAAEDCPSEDRFSVAQLLIEHGAYVNAQDVCGETPLHLAPRFWDLNLVRILVDRGANVNAEDSQGLIPLHRVLEAKGFADEDRFGIAQLLVERGADVNARHENHDTPLHLVSSKMELSLVRILLDHGANANAEDNRGRTPLHRVSEGSHNSHVDRFNVARLLVEGGANANTLDKHHETPLHVASRLASLEVVWVLLKHGADLTVENKEGKIPFQLVQEDMREDMKRSRPEYSIWRSQREKGVVLMALLYCYSCGY
jgi:serine/threonine-protein phosphatase 6 regulatory ankyrin repeat subunit B